jgi:hypothetical protein
MADVQPIRQPEEELLTPQELAKLWKFDESTIRRWFMDEPGVVVFGEEDRRDGKRQHTKLRIPQTVAQRVLKSRMR